jgi:hypothetical protein
VLKTGIRDLILPTLEAWEAAGADSAAEREYFIASAEEIARHSGREAAWKWTRAYRQAWHDRKRGVQTPWPAHPVLERIQEEQRWRVS